MKNFIKYAILWPIFIIGFLFFVKNGNAIAAVDDFEGYANNNLLDNDISPVGTWITAPTLYPAIVSQTVARSGNKSMSTNINQNAGSRIIFDTTTNGIFTFYFNRVVDGCGGYDTVSATAQEGTPIFQIIWGCYGEFFWPIFNDGTGSTTIISANYPKNTWTKTSFKWVGDIVSVYIDDVLYLTRSVYHNSGIFAFTFDSVINREYFFDDISIQDNQPLDNTTINLDGNLLDWRSDINTVDYQLCFFGDLCRLWFSFNDKAIGNNVYLTPDQQLKQNPAYALATTTIFYDPRYQNYINTPAQTVATATDYCLYMIDDTYGDLLYCGITIEWVSSSTYASDIFNKLDIAHACDTVSTSSGSFFDDFRYGIECGFRKVSFWAFTPTPDSVKYFFESSQKIKTVFPFNTYFSLVSAAQDAIASSSISRNNTIGLPMIDTGGNFYILPVLASSSMSNTIGSANNNIFRSTLGWIMWLIVAAIVFFTFKKI